MEQNSTIIIIIYTNEYPRSSRDIVYIENEKYSTYYTAVRNTCIDVLFIWENVLFTLTANLLKFRHELRKQMILNGNL